MSKARVSKILAISISLFYFLAPVFNHWVEGLNDFWSFCLAWFFAVFGYTCLPLAEILRPGTYKEYQTELIRRGNANAPGNTNAFGSVRVRFNRLISSSRFSFVSEEEPLHGDRLIVFSWLVLIVPLVLYIFYVISN